MIENKELIIIYTQLTSTDMKMENFDNSYYILYGFNEKGLVEPDLLEDLYKETIENIEKDLLKKDSIIGPFLSFETLQNYCYKLCVELNAPSVILCSVEDYNLAAENALNNSEFVEALIKNGKSLENMELKTSKGLLGKLFS